MKKFLILLFIALLSSGIYVSANSISNPSYDVVRDDSNFVGRFFQEKVAPKFNYYYFTNEEHNQILEKRIELTEEYLMNYDSMTSVEKLQAEEKYNSTLNTFILDLTGDSIDLEIIDNQIGGRMLSRVDVETHEQIISKRVELTLKFFSDFSLLTDEDKINAYENYRNEIQDFMSSIRENIKGKCQGNGPRGGQRGRVAGVNRP